MRAWWLWVQRLATRTLWGPAAVLAAVTVGLAYLSEVDPNEPGHYPTCPSLLVAGVYCPGCGTLRMLHALTHRDLATAVAMNPLALVLLPVLVAYYVEWVWLLVTRRPRRSILPSWLVWLFLAAVCAYWLLRNLPAFAWLAPG